MSGDAHGTETQKEPQAQEDLGQQQAAQDQPQVSSADWERAVAERDEKITALEAQVAEAAKNAEQLRDEIAELKAHGESDRIDSSCSSLAFATLRRPVRCSATTTAKSQEGRGRRLLRRKASSRRGAVIGTPTGNGGTLRLAPVFIGSPAHQRMLLPLRVRRNSPAQRWQREDGKALALFD